MESRGSTLVDLRRRGLPCRGEGCFAVFRRAGDDESLLALRVAAADREQHERAAHGLSVGGPGSADAPRMLVASPRRAVRSEPSPGELEAASLRRRLLELLSGGPSTLAELADAYEVPDARVRSELKVLLAADLVRIQPNRVNPGRGRPRYRYALTTEAAELVRGRADSEARDLLIDARAVGGEKLIEEIFRMRAVRLARHYRSRVSGSLRERVESMTAILEEHHGTIEVIQLALDSFVLSVRGSRIFNVDRDDSRLCAYQLDLLQRLLHAPVALSEEERESDECVYLVGRVARGARPNASLPDARAVGAPATE